VCALEGQGDQAGGALEGQGDQAGGALEGQVEAGGDAGPTAQVQHSWIESSLHRGVRHIHFSLSLKNVMAMQL
jgi:hypothetical protein